MPLIDEAQAVPDIGFMLKLMLDSIDGLKILVTGSPVFDLTNTLGEPLVGREMTLYLFSLAQIEFGQGENNLETRGRLEQRLVYGSYPELVHIVSNGEKADY